MDVKTQQKIKKLFQAVDDEKLKIAKARDNIRELISDIEEILADSSDAVEEIFEGLQLLHRGVDSLSRSL